jgi:hypothetical protein
VREHLSDEERETVAADRSNGAFDAHLAECEVCRKHVADARARRRLLFGLTPYTLSDMAFRRVEAKVAERIELEATSRWPLWVKVLMPLSVGLAALMLVAPWRKAPNPEASPSAAGLALDEKPLAPFPFETMTVMFASTDARVRSESDPWHPLQAAQRIETGRTIVATRLIVVRTDDPLTFESSGAWSSGGSAMATLESGMLAANGRAEILAGNRRFRAVEAVFSVERTAAEVILTVHRGEVSVIDESSHRSLAIRAPARLQWPTHSALDAGVLLTAHPFSIPPAAKGPLIPVDTSRLPAGSLISVDDLSWGATPFFLALPEGKHLLHVQLPGGRSYRQSLVLLAGNSAVLTEPPRAEKRAEPKDLQQEPDEAAVAELMDALRHQTPKLRACYEKWLKANPNAQGQIDLHITVTAQGTVAKADVSGEPIPPESAACLKRTAKSLVLPSLGSDQAFEVPLVLTPHAE